MWIKATTLEHDQKEGMSVKDSERYDERELKVELYCLEKKKERLKNEEARE